MFDRLKNLFTTKSTLDFPDASFLALLGGGTVSSSGSTVNATTAMQVPAVQTAISIISGSLSSLPAKVFIDLPEGGKAPDPKHPAYDLVNFKANPWTAASELRKQLTVDALLFGNGYALANRVNGKVIELIRLSPSSVAPYVDQTTGEPYYVVRQGKMNTTYQWTDIVHVHGMVTNDGVTGIAPIYMARQAIGLLIAMESHTGRIFAKGGRPSGVLVAPATAKTPAAIEKIKTIWNASHSGDSSGSTAVLADGADFKELGFTSVDQQFLELRNFQITEVARAFNIAPHLIGDLTRATWSNAEQGDLQFFKYCLLPLLQTWVSSYTRVLLGDNNPGHSIEFVTDEFLRADTATLATAHSQYRAMGAYTANDVRRERNLAPLPGGDVLQNPFTTTTTSTVAPTGGA